MNKIDKAKDIEQLIYRELPPDRYCYIHNFIVEKDKEIERLNEELNCYKFPSCKSDDIEVVRLNLVDMMRKNKRLEQENERLNNIINELDIEANKNIQVCNNKGFNLISNIDEVKTLDDFTFNEYIGYLVSLEILDKLQELKGSDKQC